MNYKVREKISLDSSKINTGRIQNLYEDETSLKDD